MMNLDVSDKVRPLLDAVAKMLVERVYPVEAEFEEEIGKHPKGRFHHTDRQLEILDGLKKEAKARGLWNFWLTDSERGYGLNTVEYAYLAAEMGKSKLGPETFNCSAPDTGNMEVLERYGTEKMKKDWLEDLMEGKIRSAYLMTEPQVASSDATNISMSAVREGDEWVLNGEKWWASGAGDPRCKVYIVMTNTDAGNENKHRRHSMILVPAGTPGVEVLRPMQVFGQDDAPHGHMHMRFTNVRVPYENLILGEGRGFEVSQGRLGPGRIHHAMRAIGAAERALESMCRRALSRTAFGKKLADLGANHDIIAECRMEIDMARLLCLQTCHMMDTIGNRAAAPWISKIKVIAPRVSLKVIDEAIQMHGGMGVSQDTHLADAWIHQRTLRLADGPDAVHRRVIARDELKKYTNEAV
ncbi:MAG: acyl-CoA dehydrogenase family protein [Pikeienuella sp.]|uniref:acyl-CoA dehydrogenase family protein n=1 Tax=Pikeienuella sp. TaxID=2831957 RepID=UPI00391CCBAF